MKAWLRKQPREVSGAFAARAALRVLPILQNAQARGIKGDLFADIALPVFRATGVAWAAAKYPDEARAIRAAAPANFTAAARCADAAVYAATIFDADAIWSTISFDATRVDAGVPTSVIAGMPLWSQGQPDQLRSLWQGMKALLKRHGGMRA